jgi:carboxypeptidase C (cathepsin A)
MTTAMVDFVTRVVGWKVDARYNALSYDVNRLWDRGDDLRTGAVPDLREAVAADPKLRVLIVHGWNDLSCPFMGSVLTVDQMPVMGDPTRVAVHEYPGGHMFYTRESSRMDLRKDVMEMYKQALSDGAPETTKRCAGSGRGSWLRRGRLFPYWWRRVSG